VPIISKEMEKMIQKSTTFITIFRLKKVQLSLSTIFWLEKCYFHYDNYAKDLNITKLISKTQKNCHKKKKESRLQA
jgi:hypothetical protein